MNINFSPVKIMEYLTDVKYVPYVSKATGDLFILFTVPPIRTCPQKGLWAVKMLIANPLSNYQWVPH